MTPLATAMLARIAASGPMTLADYMAECLLHPEHGYYATRDPFGAAGDFITAPEISQMFGEMLGLTLAQAWMDQGQPQFTLAELGPGRGTLMADMLRATAGIPGFHAAADVVMVEASAVLRDMQVERVPVARHLDDAAGLPDAPLFLVANEFFDALPVRQFVRAGDGWSEVMVTARDGALALARAAPAPVAALADRLSDTKDGDIVELCQGAGPVCTAIGARIANHGGAALIIDYGDWVSLGDTLQAMRAHAAEGILDFPGAADLTAHVDFAALAQACAPAVHGRLTPQGVFLERLGITARAQALAKRLTGDALDQHIAAHRRLTHPAEMGDHFKVLGIWRDGAPAIPGLMQ